MKAYVLAAAVLLAACLGDPTNVKPYATWLGTFGADSGALVVPQGQSVTNGWGYIIGVTAIDSITGTIATTGVALTLANPQHDHATITGTLSASTITGKISGFGFTAAPVVLKR